MKKYLVNGLELSAESLRQYFISKHPKNKLSIEEEKEMDITRLNWLELRGEKFSRRRCVSVAGCRSIANIAMKSCW